MDDQSETFDSPTGWVNKHIRSYVESDGESGHMWQGKPTLLLTTIGRKSGLHRRTALIYGQDGDDYVVVASRGGNAEHPAWYLNLVDNPAVEVQVGADKFTASATTAVGEERARLWSKMVSLWKTYDSFQAKTKREIPIVVLKHI
ncbi:MAG: nitroreductase family deazaflavin-dependent oxidoreductase [Burkholderiales bacterium]|nr:nitroreductase family deazaflavin-dependent oxidoreductase [Anaerolineae bacterium]